MIYFGNPTRYHHRIEFKDQLVSPKILNCRTRSYPDLLPCYASNKGNALWPGLAKHICRAPAQTLCTDPQTQGKKLVSSRHSYSPFFFFVSSFAEEAASAAFFCPSRYFEIFSPMYLQDRANPAVNGPFKL